MLVALINTPRDLELAQQERWYRIPARHAPKYFAGAQYLAFYLPAAFGARKWSIDSYAPVRGHELVRRRDLLPEQPDHPHADELYYKLQLGASEPRVPPIRARRGRRVLFLWTNWEKFSTATEWNDLYLRTPAHEALWDALRAENLDVDREMTIRDGATRYRVDFLIHLARGRVAVSLGDKPGQQRIGKHILALTVTPHEIDNHLGRIQRQLRRAARELKTAYSERSKNHP